MSAVDLLREDKDNEVIIAVAAFVLIGFYIFILLFSVSCFTSLKIEGRTVSYEPRFFRSDLRAGYKSRRLKTRFRNLKHRPRKQP